MFKKIILGQIRHLLGAGGSGLTAWLIAHGASATDVDVMISGLLTAIGFIWSWYAKYREENSPIKIQKFNAVFMLFGLALLLSSCSTNCFEKAAIAKMSVPLARKSAADLAESGNLSIGAAIEAQRSIDIAKNSADKAASLCFQNESTALDYIRVSGEALTEATKIVEKSKEDNANE